MSHYDQIEDILSRHYVPQFETQNERPKKEIDAIIRDVKKLNKRIGFKASFRTGDKGDFRMLDYLK